MSRPTNISKSENSSIPISIAERETGISRDTLRKWELRYGFPIPERDNRGERFYPPEQLEQLRLIKRLIDRGMRPVKLLSLDSSTLKKLADITSQDLPAPHSASELAIAVLQALETYNPEELLRILTQELMNIGLTEFVQAKLPPLHDFVGDAWASGQLAIHQEHLYSETLQTLLRETIGSLHPSSGGARVILATLPGELHTLGLLMAQAQLSLCGARCISLGSQTPMSELVAAAQAYKADVVGLSFSVVYPVRQIAPQLTEFRRQLNPAIKIWAGGRGISRVRHIPNGVTPLLTLNEAAVALSSL